MDKKWCFSCIIISWNWAASHKFQPSPKSLENGKRENSPKPSLPSCANLPPPRTYNPPPKKWCRKEKQKCANPPALIIPPLGPTTKQDPTTRRGCKWGVYREGPSKTRHKTQKKTQVPYEILLELPDDNFCWRALRKFFAPFRKKFRKKQIRILLTKKKNAKINKKLRKFSRGKFRAKNRELTESK